MKMNYSDNEMKKLFILLQYIVLGLAVNSIYLNICVFLHQQYDYEVIDEELINVTIIAYFAYKIIGYIFYDKPEKKQTNEDV